MNKVLFAAIPASLVSAPALAESLVSMHGAPGRFNLENPLVIGLVALLAGAVAFRMLRSHKSKQQ